MAEYIPNQNDDQDHLLNIMLGHFPSLNYNQHDFYQINHYQTDQLLRCQQYPSAHQLPPIDFLHQQIQFSASLPYSVQRQSKNLQYSQQSPQLQKTQSLQIKQVTFPAKKQKNSNTIKKIGRIILDNLKQYKSFIRPNTSVLNMLKTLSKSSKVGRTEINKRDKFNTHHLRLLVNSKDDELVSHNLRTTRKILSKYLRDNVLSSKQISDQNKILYLSTMKCSGLRCANKKLAVRLQMSMRE